MGKYERIAFAPILIAMLGLMCYIEYELFTTDWRIALVGNFMIAWVFFFLYKEEKERKDVNASNKENDKKT